MYCSKRDSKKKRKTKTRKLKADKGKKNEYDPSFLLELEDLKE